MLLRMPGYYKNFRCMASECSDNCCIGWEIDIDSTSLKKYGYVNGEFGRRLEQGISKNGTPHFVLLTNGRCPFLNQNNLCDIYINLGEDSLCSICTEHPRYFEWYDGIKEGGIGLCCEAAAELILTHDEKFSYYDKEIPSESCRNYDDEFYNYLFRIRSDMIAFAENRSVPFKGRLCGILEYADKMQEKFDEHSLETYRIIPFGCVGRPLDAKGVIYLFQNLESMDERRLFRKIFSEYENILAAAGEFFEKFPEAEIYLEKILVYFLWRHLLKGVFDDEFYSRAAFAVLSTAVTALLFINEYLSRKVFDLETAVRICVYYSKEVEYSEENMNKLLDAFYDYEEFTVENIGGMLNIF